MILKYNYQNIFKSVVLQYMCFFINTLNNRIQHKSNNYHIIQVINMNSYFEISANTVTCYVNICNCYYKQSRVLLIPLWFVVSIITEENDEFQLQVGENKGVICFSSEFTDPLNPIQGHFRTPGMESLCTRILIRERESKAETQA